MRILHVIGNGFDINLGLKTKYSEFYKYYASQQSDDSLINELKQDIELGIETWADLELAFGKYTKNLNDMVEFDRVWEDIVDNLCNYLESEEQILKIDKLNIEKFLSDLYTPELSLAQGYKEEIINFKNQFGAVTWNVNVITLNYTRTLERILEGKFPNHHIGSHQQGKVKFGNIQHIHGYTDDRTILGVNDESQVGKIDFRTNREILEALIKSTSNEAQKHNVDRICKNHIAEASLICIFGSSLGETDNYLWTLIGEQLKRGLKLIIFRKGEPIKGRFGHIAPRSQRAVKMLFLNRTMLTDVEKNALADNIYVALNTDLFSF